MDSSDFTGTPHFDRWRLIALNTLAETRPGLVQHALVSLMQHDDIIRMAIISIAYARGLLTLNETASLLGMTPKAVLAQFSIAGVHNNEEEDTSAAILQCALG